jgi:hypothetical protein
MRNEWRSRHDPLRRTDQSHPGRRYLNMRGLSAIGMVMGLVMMTAPLWLPRLGLGSAGPLSFGTPGAAQGMPSRPDTPAVMRPDGGGAVSGVFRDVMAALDKAGGMVGAPPSMLPPGAGPVGAVIGQPRATTPDYDPAAFAQVCGALAATGRMSQKDCAAQMAPAIAAQTRAMGEVERAMQGNRTFGTVKPTKKNPGAKFIRVEK